MHACSETPEQKSRRAKYSKADKENSSLGQSSPSHIWKVRDAAIERGGKSSEIMRIRKMKVDLL
jgi:hypothetical protein